jgi:CHAT domain-containing protein/tetratricopeptide (TPR) repeat protein
MLVVAVIAAGGTLAGVELGTEIRNATSLRDCDELVQRRPGEGLAYECFLDLVRRQRSSTEVVRYLESLLRLDPANAWLRLTLGRVEAQRNQDVALEHYEAALAGFLEQRILDGAFYTRTMRAYFHQYRDRLDDAAAELKEAEKLALEARDPNLIAHARLRRGSLAHEREDYGLAWVLLKKAEQAAFPDASQDVQVFVLQGLGAATEALGRYGEALEYHRRIAEIIGDRGVLMFEASVRLKIAELAGRVRVPRAYTPEERRTFAEQALDVAVRSGATIVETPARLLLGRILDGRPATEQTEEALRLARELRNSKWIVIALRQLAVVRLENAADTTTALDLVDESIDLARSLGMTEQLARGLAVRSELRRRAGDHDLAVGDGLAALEAIETFRDLQPDEQVRARTFARFADGYYRLSGHLLDAAMAAEAEDDLALAFRVSERMRARVLLDALDAARATPAVGRAGPLREQRAENLAAIARVQQRLIDPNLTDADRQTALSELEALEIEETALRDLIAREDPDFAAVRRPTMPSLSEVQQSLAEDQALLAFQIEPAPEELPDDWRGGSWVLCVTRDDTKVHRVPDAESLEREVQLFLGLVGRRDGAERRGARVLYEHLLEGAVRDIPDSVRRLVIVPDGALHRLPFHALRAEADGPPLGARYSIAVTPSATVWLRCRERVVPHPDSRTALVFADPSLPGADEAASERGAHFLRDFPQLGSLPEARREARDLVRHIGGDPRLAEGDEATEHLLKSLPLSEFKIIHLAAHAVVDDEQPQRSAVVLSAGAADEDGLLQMREIVELDLAGQVVVLSACSSAAGSLIEGEGVMGLARAFLQAGAYAVVASLWPLKDHEAADFFEDFYRGLGRGDSLADALGGARRRHATKGASTAAWGGVILIGNDEIVPLPGGRRAGPVPPWALLALVAILVVLTIWIWRMRLVRKLQQTAAGD